MLSEGPEHDSLSEVWERSFDFAGTPLPEDSIVIWDRTGTLVGLAIEISRASGPVTGRFG